jgi:hypothetical protein
LLLYFYMRQVYDVTGFIKWIRLPVRIIESLETVMNLGDCQRLLWIGSRRVYVIRTVHVLTINIYCLTDALSDEITWHT